MVRTITATCCILIATLGLPGSTPAADRPRDPASEVLAVFSAKCAGCHGPDLPTSQKADSVTCSTWPE